MWLCGIVGGGCGEGNGPHAQNHSFRGLRYQEPLAASHGQRKVSSAFPTKGRGAATSGFPIYPEERLCSQVAWDEPAHTNVLAEEYNHTLKASLWHR